MHISTIRIPEELYKFLKVEAAVNDYRSVNELITLILSDYKQKKEEN